MSSDTFLETASAIGRRIVAEAVWHEGRCSWVGAAAKPAKRSMPEYRPVGPLLYDGTAGIGLFLAQLFAATGEEPLRRTALGAVRHAVDRPAPPHGLYAGAPGIAWAAARVAALLDADEPAAGAPAPVAANGDLSLRTGTAGTIAALLGCAAVLNEPRFVATASNLGESLITAHGSAPPGTADGAAGINAALHALAVATGDPRFNAAFTTRATPRQPTCAPPGTAHSWCTSDPNGQHTNILSRALHDAMPYAIDDFSLCHGLTGLSFTLLATGDTETPTALAHVAIDRYARDHDWPCGVYGTTPNLFRGLSGIGWFFLAVHNPETASPIALPSAVDNARHAPIRSRSGPTRR